MAFSPKFISSFFLFTLLIAQIFARESQFFSKVSGTTTTTTPTTVNNPATTTTTTVNGKETTIPNKEEGNFNFKNQEQEPSFMPETQNGYGLYGQELNDQESNTQFPTTTKLGNAQYTTGTTTSAATYTPYKTPTREPYTYNTNTNPNANYYSNNQYNTNGFEYEQQQHNFGETSLQERSFTPLSNQNNYYRNNGGVGFNQEGRQGMSDTRFLENGRYFHDIHNENKIPTNNYYNTPAGYYNNNNNNNENTYEYNKYSMENQQEDFQEREDEQYVP